MLDSGQVSHTSRKGVSILDDATNIAIKGPYDTHAHSAPPNYISNSRRSKRTWSIG
jgi:hypothetical protein